MPIKSGPYWITWANQNAPNSHAVADLVEPFRSGATAFIAALKAAGATVTVTATRRHPMRAYLFHWCWLVSLGKKTAAQADASPMNSVDIEWDHGTNGASVAGAMAMVNGFGLAVPPASQNAPALTSNHIAGLALDMDIIWSGILQVKDEAGAVVNVAWNQDVNANHALHTVGASYGVIKLTSDAPHWSVDGH
jgi:hypothetical protein